MIKLGIILFIVTFVITYLLLQVGMFITMIIDYISNEPIQPPEIIIESISEESLIR